MPKRWFPLLLLLGVSVAGLTRWLGTPGEKRVIGQTARVEIAEAGIEFLGRVDTGAASTSVHAESITREGDMVAFELINRAGERVQLRAPHARTTTVRNAEGSEERLYVELTICHDGESKRVLANLNDRSNLTYALLLGRNWLQNDFIVDVTREAVRPPEQPDLELPVQDNSPRLASRSSTAGKRQSAPDLPPPTERDEDAFAGHEEHPPVLP